MSKKADISLSIGVSTKDLQKGLYDAVKMSTDAGAKMEKEAKQQVAAIEAQMAKIGNAKNLSQVNRQMENLVGMMSSFGMEGSKAFNEVVKQAGALKDKQADLRSMIDAHTTLLPWKAMSGAIQGTANIMTSAQGAMAMFGAESEDVQETMMKVQAAMAFSQGLDGIEQLQESFVKLGMVIRANPIFFAATAIAAIAVVAYKLSTELNAAERAQEDFNKAMAEGVNNAQKDVTNLKLLAQASSNMSIGLKERKAAYEKLQNGYPEYFKNLTYEEFLTKKGTAATIAATNAIVQKAKMAALTEQITEKQKELNTAIADGEGVLSKIGKGLSRGTYDAYGKNINDLKNDINNLTLAAAKLQEKNAKQLYTTDEPTVKSAGKSKSSDKKTNPYEVGLKSLENNHKAAINLVLEKQVLNKITQEQANREMRELELQHQKDLLTIAEKYGKDRETAHYNLLQTQIAYLEEYKAKLQGAEWNSLSITPPDLKPIEVAATTTADNVSSAYDEIQIGFGQLVQQNLQSSISGMAELMAQAMTTGEDIGQAMGSMLLMGFADFLVQLGDMMVAAGIAKAGFDAAMVAAGGAGGAIAAGFGLMLAGNVFKSAMAKPIALAEGGVMKGTTFGMLAEYPTANNDPEVAIRSSYLRGMITDAVGGDNNGTFTTKISGRDLYILLERGKNDYKRG